VDENGNTVNASGANTVQSINTIFDAEKVAKEIQAQTRITQAFSQQASTAVTDYTQNLRKTLQDQLKQSNSEENTALIESQLAELFLEEKVMNVLIGAVTGFGGVALSKESLSIAADKMRKLMIEDSELFAGVTDGITTLDNISADSEGVRGDGKKVGGTRVDLDKLCGIFNERCKKQKDTNGKEIMINGQSQLLLNNKGQVQFDTEAAGMKLADFLKTEQGQELSGSTGGMQGWVGTLFGKPYLPSSMPDKVIEAFSGTHDFVGGKLSGLYDEQGNATRGRSEITTKAQNTWSATGAIVISTPFAAAELLPAEVWNAISILLKNAK